VQLFPTRQVRPRSESPFGDWRQHAHRDTSSPMTCRDGKSPILADRGGREDNRPPQSCGPVLFYSASTCRRAASASLIA